jgi:hypothetical protein
MLFGVGNMNFKSLGFLLAVVLLTPEQSQAITVDATQSASVTYDYTGTSLAGPYTSLWVDVTANVLTGNTFLGGGYAGSIEASFFDSSNNLLYNSFGSGYVGNGQDFLFGGGFIPALTTAPVGSVVFSSFDGSAFNILSATMFLSNDPNTFCCTTLDVTGSLSTVAVSATPLPAALPLFAGGLGALGLLGWRRKRKAALAA